MLIGTVTISRPASLPIERESGREQNVFDGGDGSFRVRDKAPARRLLTYKVRMTQAEYEALEVYLRVTVGFKKTPFTVVDDWGTSFTARYWDTKLKTSEKLGRYHEASLPFLVEDVES